MWGKATDASVDELKRKIDETVREPRPSSRPLAHGPRPSCAAWREGGGARSPLRVLHTAWFVRVQVREYFSSGGLDEAVRCVRELAAPMLCAATCAGWPYACNNPCVRARHMHVRILTVMC